MKRAVASILMSGALSVSPLRALAEGHGCGDSSSAVGGGGHDAEHSGPACESEGAASHIPLTYAKIRFPKRIEAKKVATAYLQIFERGQHRQVSRFENIKTKRMHLIVVDRSLGFFKHLHPRLLTNGNFKTRLRLPSGGNYFLFLEYQPKGSPEQMVLLPLNVPGKPSSPPVKDFATTKHTKHTEVILAPHSGTLKSAETSLVTILLRDDTNGSTPTDLGTYLGAKAHMIVLKDGAKPLLKDFSHAHTLESSGTELHFALHFPTPGTYKMWVQFVRSERLHEASFYVSVS